MLHFSSVYSACAYLTFGIAYCQIADHVNGMFAFPIPPR